jgi:hypothetical protein
MGDPTTYPEHVKLRAVSDETQAAGGFLVWCAEQGLELSHVQSGNPCMTPMRDLLAAWKDIDQAKIEEEKRAMLKAMREMNEASDG